MARTGDPDPTRPNLGLGHTADCPKFHTHYPWRCDCQVRAAAAALAAPAADRLIDHHANAVRRLAAEPVAPRPLLAALERRIPPTFALIDPLPVGLVAIERFDQLVAAVFARLNAQPWISVIGHGAYPGLKPFPLVNVWVEAPPGAGRRGDWICGVILPNGDAHRLDRALVALARETLAAAAQAATAVANPNRPAPVLADIALRLPNESPTL